MYKEFTPCNFGRLKIRLDISVHINFTLIIEKYNKDINDKTYQLDNNLFKCESLASKVGIFISKIKSGNYKKKNVLSYTLILLFFEKKLLKNPVSSS